MHIIRRRGCCVLQAGLVIKGTKPEVWITKALKQWLISVGGEEALTGAFALVIMLDGSYVCSV
jgi:hypothetical protein